LGLAQLAFATGGAIRGPSLSGPAADPLQANLRADAVSIAPRVLSCPDVQITFVPASITAAPGATIGFDQHVDASADAAPGVRQCVVDLGAAGQSTIVVDVTAGAEPTETPVAAGDPAAPPAEPAAPTPVATPVPVVVVDQPVDDEAVVPEPPSIEGPTTPTPDPGPDTPPTPVATVAPTVQPAPTSTPPAPPSFEGPTPAPVAPSAPPTTLN
ncbi:MAG: hypothetical protein KDB21_14695, partial [Acidimicrobiales bacterium]|nr:hypothetical protein [Acidimicrobiales bacterium]